LGKVKFYSYEELLTRALSQLPSKPSARVERFRVPSPEIMISGKRTFVQNFKQIADILNRDPRHLLRFLLKELAAPGTLEETMAVIQGEFSPKLLNNLLQRYIRTYVICPVCKNPDTFLVKEKRVYFLVCAACGAKSSVPPLV